MASIIRIKRSGSSGNPSTLGTGELAYSALVGTQSNGGDRLYIGFGTEEAGNAAEHFVIGGKYFTDMMDHAHGTLTADSALIVDSNKKIDELNVDNITLNGNTISSTNSNGNIVLDPNGTGYVTISGTNSLIIPVGTTAQQGPAIAGAIRLNSDTSQFEGYSGTNWGSLGGVKSVDGLTYITPELTPGASDDTLRFYTDGTLRMSLDTDSLDIGSTITTVNIDATTASTSTSTGALVVDGGVGIGGSLYVSGAISAASATFASINDTPIGNVTPSTGAFTTLTANNSVTFTKNTGSTSTTTGTLVVTGGVGISENLFVGGDLQVNGNDIRMNGDQVAITFSGTGDVAVYGDLKVGGNDIKASDGTTALTLSDSTGNVAVAGDLTVTGNDIKSSTATAITLSGTDVSVAGDLTVTGNDINSSTGTAISLSGTDVKVQGDLTVGGQDIKASDGTTAITLSNTSGDVAVAGDLTVTGNDIKSSTGTAISLNGADVNVLGSLDVDVNLNVDGTAQIDGATTIGASDARSAFTVYGTAVSVTGSDNSQIGVTAATGSATTFTITASNSVGDANLDINVDDAATLDATTISLDATDNSNFSVTANSSDTKTLALDATNAGAGAAEIAVGSVNTDYVTLRSATKTQINSTTEVEVLASTFDAQAGTITLTTSGAGNSVTVTSAAVTSNADTVIFRGTEGAGDTAAVSVTGTLDVDNIRLDGNTISTTDGSNTIYIDPAPSGSQGLVVIEGDLQVNGTTTTINSTEVTIEDPIFVLGGETPPETDDNLDRGIEFRWHDGTDPKLGFFGYDDSAAEFVFIPDATDTAGVISGTVGNAALGKLRLTDTTASTTTTTGALTVAGGAGIGGQLNVAGTTNKFTSTQASTTTTTGAVVVAGGVGIGGSIYLGDDLVGAGAATSNLDGFNIDGGTY